MNGKARVGQLKSTLYLPNLQNKYDFVLFA